MKRSAAHRHHYLTTLKSPHVGTRTGDRSGAATPQLLQVASDGMRVSELTGLRLTTFTGHRPHVLCTARTKDRAHPDPDTVRVLRRSPKDDHR